MSKKNKQNEGSMHPLAQRNMDAGNWLATKVEKAWVNKYTVGKRKYLINQDHFTSIIKDLEGVVLTLIESSTDDQIKREATKSIARNMIWDKASQIYLMRLQREDEAPEEVE